MSAAIQIVPRTEVAREKWDAFVDANDEAWLWHRGDLIEAVALWPEHLDASIAVVDSRGAILAVVPLHRKATRVAGMVPCVRLSSLGGPACATRLSGGEREKVLSVLHEHMLSLVAEQHALAAEAYIAALTPSLNRPDSPKVNPLIAAGFENTQTETWIVDLSGTPENIRRQYSDTTRYEVRKAARTEFRLREATEPKDIDIYYRLHLETYDRTGAKPLPHRYFQAIFEKCRPQGLARILFLERNGEVMAAQNTAIYKGGALYWTGASRSEKEGGDNRLLMDSQIMMARDDGCTRYETGQAFINPATAKEHGLSNFKRSFGAELYPFYQGILLSTRFRYRTLWALRNLKTTMLSGRL